MKMLTEAEYNELVAARDHRDALLTSPRGTDAQILKEREICASAISGAMAFGFQGHNPAPQGDWLEPFWQLGRERREVQEERDRLHRLINTPELIDFPRAVHLEAVHQKQRWGTEDREGKSPAAWFWLLSHLATRALEHHKNAERLVGGNADDPNGLIAAEIAHHREKAAHHCITAAAVLSHWHASVIGKYTAMRPASALPAELATAPEARHG